MSATREIVRDRRTRALVSPERNGWVAVYPAGLGQDPAVAAELARRLECVVLHLAVRADRELSIRAWRAGELLEEYVSNDRADPRERPALAEWGGAIRTASEYPECPDHAHQRMGRLAEWLGLTNAVEAYEWMMDDEVDEVVGWDEFVELPGDVHPVVPQPLARTSTSFSLPPDSARVGGWVAGGENFMRAGDGFCLLREGRMCGADLRLRPLPFELDGSIRIAAHDPRARFIALITEQSIYVMDCERDELANELRSRYHYHHAAMSADGSIVAHASVSHVISVDVESARSRRTAIGHVSALACWGREWIVAAAQDVVLIPALDGSGTARRLLLPGDPKLVAIMPKPDHVPHAFVPTPSVGGAVDDLFALRASRIPERRFGRFTTFEYAHGVGLSPDERWLYVSTQLRLAAWHTTDLLEVDAQLPEPRWSVADATLVDALPNGMLLARMTNKRHVWIDGESGRVVGVTNLQPRYHVVVSTDGRLAAFDTLASDDGRPHRYWEIVRVSSLQVH